MDAIRLLEDDHRMVEALFEDLCAAEDLDEREQLMLELADALALHAAIEEQIFYPACNNGETEERLRESLEEHLQVKRILADLLELDAHDEQFMAKINVLAEDVEHHVDGEEGELFPRARLLLGDDMLLALGNEMARRRAELEEQGNPRDSIPEETAEAPAL